MFSPPLSADFFLHSFYSLSTDFHHREEIATRFFLSFLFLLPLFAFSQDMVKEPSTEKNFPKTVTCSSGTSEYTVTLTGLSVRKKYFFGVCGIAHYMQDAGTMSRTDALKACLDDGRVKQITMDFARDVDNTSIIGTYNDGFEENATTSLPELRNRGNLKQVICVVEVPELQQK